MAKFTVYVIESSPVAAFGISGERVIEAHFRIQSSGGDCWGYKGSGHGPEFALRCERLSDSAVFVEAPEPSGYDLERWKENVIQRAMSQISG